jgi:hypothetical protein
MKHSIPHEIRLDRVLPIAATAMKPEPILFSLSTVGSINEDRQSLASLWPFQALSGCLFDLHIIQLTERATAAGALNLEETSRV